MTSPPPSRAADEQTVARLLSAVYRKVGTDRAGLAPVLGEQPPNG